MKKFITLAFFSLYFFNVLYSQDGKIYPKQTGADTGSEVVYIYEPPKDLKIQGSAIVQVLLDEGIVLSAPLMRVGSYYQFSIKQPSTASFAFFAIKEKGKIIDNNNGKGYVIYPGDKSGEGLDKAKINKMVLDQYAAYLLKVDYKPKDIIAALEGFYNKNPSLKNIRGGYLQYLRLKYNQDAAGIKPVIIKYAALLETKKDEASLMQAKQLYSMLKMKEKNVLLNKKILAKYPAGALAKNNFWDSFYTHDNKTADYILKSIDEFQEKFKDNSSSFADDLYTRLAAIYLDKREMAEFDKTQSLIVNKTGLAQVFNNVAWNLTGGNLTDEGKELTFARDISKRSMEIVKRMVDSASKGEDIYQLQSAYAMYADTYALIMYKQGKYDSAYFYQNEIYQMDTAGMGADGRERYAAYMEKFKGAAYTKDFIEQQIEQGDASALMLSQLQEIYKKLQVPDAEYEAMNKIYHDQLDKKLKAAVVEKYGTLKAQDFTLTNLAGKTIKLSDYLGKIVVLDFWATWCGPCRASFPGMQKLVNEYKGKEVEFFFIDTFQEGTAAEIKKEVAKFISDEHYTFNVLMDYKKEVANNYKIEFIPSKIVIDKNGDILSVDSSEDNLKALIEEGLK